jgi:hypothetical protein
MSESLSSTSTREYLQLNNIKVWMTLGKEEVKVPITKVFVSEKKRKVEGIIYVTGKTRTVSSPPNAASI